MVRTLHRAGLEVILDVVYNHTGEGNQLGPTLSLRGVDNSLYYRLNPEDPRYYIDYTGTGNSLNILHLGLVTDSLRYWVTDMHVDGFRFDLAPVLVRGYEAGHPSAFFEIIQQDPVLSQVKLIAEPWDASPDGYQLGRFPPGWSEWNGAFRDCVRRFWRGDPEMVPELASRLSGSSRHLRAERSAHLCQRQLRHLSRRLHAHRPRHLRPQAQRGQRRGQPGRHRRELQPNWGVEGPTDSVRIQRLRDRMKRNLLATLFFSQGVPMLLGGDEIGRTQQGNNNAYCQDNEISWFDWDIGETGWDMYNFVRDLIAVMQSNPILRRRNFFTGESPPGLHTKDVTWIRPDGTEMTDEDWSGADRRSIGMLLFGQAADEVDMRGRSAAGDTLVVAAERRLEIALVHAPAPGAARPLGGSSQHRPAGAVGAPDTKRRRQPDVAHCHAAAS